MAIISSYGSLRALATPPPIGMPPSARPITTGGWWETYATIYRTQPNVRTCVDFLARNIAQLSIHLYRRVSDLDRVRVSDHPAAQTLMYPNPATTRYRLIESLMQDLGVYFAAFWLKVRTNERLGLVRLPPAEVATVGTVAPSAFLWYPQGRSPITFAPSEIIAFGGYDPINASFGISPIETLRQVLAEDIAATDYRSHFWLNAARVEGVIERPSSAPNWTPQQRTDFRASWQEAHGGGANAGKTAILEDGMTWKQTSSTFKDSEFIGARKLTQEECARAYHIPLPMVGILDHATFSNIREQHKQLYQDSLGPWLAMIEGELVRQLLSEYEDGASIYPEFNIAEKLQGSFEEQAASLRALVGRPLMTANEGRARLNLPRDDNPASDELAQPLNMSNPGGNPSTSTEGAYVDEPVALAAIDTLQWATVIRGSWSRQRDRVQKDPPEQRARRFDDTRWTAELARELGPLYLAAGITEWDRPLRAATAITRTTRALLAANKPAFGIDRPVPRPEELS